jgi:hypothetical protein
MPELGAQSQRTMQQFNANDGPASADDSQLAMSGFSFTSSYPAFNQRKAKQIQQLLSILVNAVLPAMQDSSDIRAES